MVTKTGTYRGTVTAQGNKIVLDDGVALPPGTDVLVTPEAARRPRRGSPAAVLKAMRSGPHLTHEDAEELRRVIQQSRADVNWRSPFPPSRKQRQGVSGK
ncbi:MAG: hypothetical protein FJ279_15520 [Planctomycetes bacterium]|nr:hypothetical protein [Planctomycetota bacterium]MBM4079104.1 hypothetical protein [Planctomycetota bacterium]MBM4085015.1 hypothetical protein [Planctomycetota bacterium]